jgi:hypothetical protein
VTKAESAVAVTKDWQRKEYSLVRFECALERVRSRRPALEQVGVDGRNKPPSIGPAMTNTCRSTARLFGQSLAIPRCVCDTASALSHWERTLGSLSYLSAASGRFSARAPRSALHLTIGPCAPLYSTQQTLGPKNSLRTFFPTVVFEIDIDNCSGRANTQWNASLLCAELVFGMDGSHTSSNDIHIRTSADQNLIADGLGP